MNASIREPLVFGVIVLLHGAAYLGLIGMRSHDQSTPVATPISVRMISPPAEQRAKSPPVNVAMVTPRIAIDPPEPPLVDLSIVEESTRAITIPVKASTPVATVEASGPKLVSAVEYVREPAPRYPPQSRRLREQGLVMLKVLIDEKGVACSIEIESSSGYARLDHAAREAVARAAFRPYVEDGEPRRALVLIPIEFYLNRSPA